MKYISLEGTWQVRLPDGLCSHMYLPGTLDENGIGYPDRGSAQVHPAENAENGLCDDKTWSGDGTFAEPAPISTRFTRKYTFEGEVRLTRNVTFRETPGKRVFLEVERARVLRLFIDGVEIPHYVPPSISTPQVFEVTGRIDGEHELTLLSDNSYPGLPRDAIVYSSAATDETQTNWNGVLGYIRLREEPETFIRAVSVYPKGNSLTVKVEIDVETPPPFGRRISRPKDEDATRRGQDAPSIERNATHLDGAALEAFSGVLTLSSEAFAQGISSPAGGRDTFTGNVTLQVNAHTGVNEFVLEGLTLTPEIRRWDEEEGNLYQMTATLARGNAFSFRSAHIPVGAERAEVEDTICELRCEEVISELTVRFGIRDFGDNGRAAMKDASRGRRCASGRLALNGRTIFLRSEANCAVFPETGYPPMDKESWKDILSRYRAYGVNCMRFHSHCPPEAAFAAADELGMLMQPELSHWNPKNAFEDKESFHYYQTELEQILRMLANHPSFVMLTFGNELWSGELGLARMHQLLERAQAFDPTRLYAIASNAFYGSKGCDEQSDFYTSQAFGAYDLRGTFAGYEGQNGIQGYINNRYPGTCADYDLSMEKLRQTYKKPVFSFEVGQFEVLPDFDELDAFHGVTRPVNLELIQEKARAAGLVGTSEKNTVPSTGGIAWSRHAGKTGEIDRSLQAKKTGGMDWERRVEATGELALIGYREEVEAAMRTRELSGISLLGLQDFPGQGTALVGMMNSHLEPKPYSFAQPERFRAFFRSQQILVRLPRYTWESDEILTAEIQVANYGKQEICAPVCYELRPAFIPSEGRGCHPARAGRAAIEDAACGRRCGEFPGMLCPTGTLTDIGRLEIPLSFAEHPLRMELSVWMAPPKDIGYREKAEGSEWVDAAEAMLTSEITETADIMKNGTSDESVEILENSYPLWVYPACAEVRSKKASGVAVTLNLEGGAAGYEAESFKEAEPFYETEHFDVKARDVLASGGIVYLTPPATEEAMPCSIKTQFTTDFWSVGTFPAQPGGMGQLIDAAHPLFQNFPTEFHTNWQWWPMATQRAIILPEYKKSIVAEMDSYAYMRPMTQLLECKCGGGRLLLSSMGLQNLTQYPEARALQRAIYTYLTSDQFRPEQEMDVETIARLVP